MRGKLERQSRRSRDFSGGCDGWKKKASFPNGLLQYLLIVIEYGLLVY